MIDLLPLAQAEALPELADRWGFAAVGIVLIVYLIWQHRQVMEKIGPLLERTTTTLERVVRMLDDMERRER